MRSVLGGLAGNKYEWGKLGWQESSYGWKWDKCIASVFTIIHKTELDFGNRSDRSTLRSIFEDGDAQQIEITFHFANYFIQSFQAIHSKCCVSSLDTE